ncbi:hypothetical protein Tco_0912909, partial [Tanacetum coccineum]
GNPRILLQDHAVVDSGCSSHMTGNKACLSDYEDFNRGFVAFGSDPKGGASLDRKSTTGGCQFLGRRLISWQCKKQIIVANSTTEAEYVAAAHLCRQVLWIQNQMIDYGFNFMNTKIHIDNKSTICVVKNPVYHSRTKHIEIQHHFIRDCYEKRLIDVLKIHTDSNVADLLTKGFDVTRISMDLRMDKSSPGKYNSSMVFHMANLKYSDKHNMVAFQKKPNESVGFTEVVDFLKGTSLSLDFDVHLREFRVPVIYGQPKGTQKIKQKYIWSLSWYEEEHHESVGFTEWSLLFFLMVLLSVASIDSKEYTITEASVRSKLQLADATRIHNYAKIYDGLATLGINSLEKELKDTKQTLGNAVLKLVKKVKSLETALKRKSKKDIDDDPLVSLVRESIKEKSTDFVTPIKLHRRLKKLLSVLTIL